MKDKKIFTSKLEELNSDAIIVLDDSTRFWLTGFKSSAGISVVSKEEVALFIDGRYTEKAYAEKPDATIYPCNSGIFSDACEYIKNKGFKTVVADEKRLSLWEYLSLSKRLEGIDVKHSKDIFKKHISVKTEKEISLIKEAVRITDECFSHLLKIIKEGITETEISAEISYFFNKSGCENAFDPIVVSGIKSSMPHGTPDNVKLTPNSFLTMDFGAKYKGYCSDLTRTIVLGKADEEMKRVYKTVLTANKKAITASNIGAKCKDVDWVARDYISSNGYGKYFSHSTGHSLGVEIHEAPSVSGLSEDVLEYGNVITIEPGIYIPGKYGVRVEDTVLITEEGPKVLSTSPKHLIEL